MAAPRLTRQASSHLTDDGDVRVNVPVIEWSDLLDPTSAALFAPSPANLLGEGGMGAVYRARMAPTSRWVSLHRAGSSADSLHVAVKVFKESAAGSGHSASDRLDPASMMRRELKQHFAVRRHPNVVNVLGMCRGSSPSTKEGYAIVMERLAGSLDAAIDGRDGGRWRSLPIVERMRRCAGLVAAIEAVHAIGMVHADVKPANVLLDDRCQLHLADFGIATVERRERDSQALQRFFTDTQRAVAATMAGAGGELMSALGSGMSALKIPRGTPVYIPPEVMISKSPNTTASDIYAVAITVTQALSCSDEMPRRLLLGLMLGCPVTPSADAIPEEVPDHLRDALVRAMGPKAEHRPTAEQLRAEFERACGPLRISGDAVAPARPSTLPAGEDFEGVRCTSGHIALGGPLRLSSHSGFSSAVLERPVQRGRWYYEAELLRCNEILQLGWADVEFRGTAEGSSGVGDDSHSWAYDPYRSTKWHGSRSIPYGRKCEPGDVVGCLLDADTKRIEFSVNGNFAPPYGAAFLDVMPTDDLFLPALTIAAGDAVVQLRISAEELKYPLPPGARAIGDAPASRPSAARVAISCTVGAHVRLRGSVTEPRFGMGRLRRGEVGVVQSVMNEVVKIRFPLAGVWNGLAEELEMASCIQAGDIVQVKPSVEAPKYGWGLVERGDLLVVTQSLVSTGGVSVCTVRALRGGQELSRDLTFLQTELEFATAEGCQRAPAPSASAPVAAPMPAPASAPASAPAISHSMDPVDGLTALLEGIITKDSPARVTAPPRAAPVSPAVLDYVTRAEGAQIVPREFPPGFVACRDREPERVDLQVGHWVRVRRSVVKAYYGWGNTCHGEIGRIIETDKDGDPVVKFPSCDRFTCEWAELQMAVYLETGDHVAWRASMREPAYGWGGVGRDELGVVRAVDPVYNVAIVRFGRRCKITCKVSELAWAQQQSEVTRRGGLPVGMHVRIREHVMSTRFGDGDVRRGEVGVVASVDGDGDPIVDWPSHKRWQAAYTDLEDASTWCVGDLVTLKEEIKCAGSNVYPAGHVGILINILPDGRARVEFERNYVTMAIDRLSDASAPLADRDLYTARPYLPGAWVRMRNGAAAAAVGLNQDQVGVVASARFDDTHWLTTVTFPGNHSWVGKAQELMPHRAMLMKGDWISLCPTMKKPLLGWGDAEGKVRYGDVGAVLELKEMTRGNRKEVVYVTMWPNGSRLNFLNFEVVPATKPPTAS